jgi:uncharacterized RDD family membrane protein YckC
LKTFTIVTPDNIEIEYRLAGVGSRLSAAFIDVCIQLAACVAVICAILFGIMQYRFSNTESFNYNHPVFALALVLVFAIIYGYCPVCELSMGGQTPGKRLFKLRAIKTNGQALSLAQALVRGVLRYSIDMLGVGAVMIFFTSKRLGDMAASTIVVAQSSEVQVSSLGPIQKEPVAMQRLSLDEDETRLLKEFFDRREHFLDRGKGLEQNLAAYFGEKFDCPPNIFSIANLYELLRINS